MRYDMAEKRKKAKSILLTVGRKKISLKLYDALEWPDEYGTGEGLYRVMIDRTWHSPAGRYTFLTMAAVGQLVATILSGGDCVTESAKLTTDFSKSLRVSVPTEYADGEPLMYEGGYTAAPAHVGPDGRTYVWCRCYSGYFEVPIENIVPHKSD